MRRSWEQMPKLSTSFLHMMFDNRSATIHYTYDFVFWFEACCLENCELIFSCKVHWEQMPKLSTNIACISSMIGKIFIQKINEHDPCWLFSYNTIPNPMPLLQYWQCDTCMRMKSGHCIAPMWVWRPCNDAQNYIYCMKTLGIEKSCSYGKLVFLQNLR